MKRALIAALAATTMAASCAYNIGEQYFFVPKPAAQIMTDPALMQMVGERSITVANAGASTEGQSPLLPPRLPATLVKELHSFGKEGRQVAVIHARASTQRRASRSLSTAAATHPT